MDWPKVAACDIELESTGRLKASRLGLGAWGLGFRLRVWGLGLRLRAEGLRFRGAWFTHGLRACCSGLRPFLISEPSHSEHPTIGSIGSKKLQTQKPVSPTPKTTKFARVLSSGSGLHQNQKPHTQRLPALVVSWLGLARACDGATASGF